MVPDSGVLPDFDKWPNVKIDVSYQVDQGDIRTVVFKPSADAASLILRTSEMSSYLGTNCLKNLTVKASLILEEWKAYAEYSLR